jgi:hypothetical protein
MLEARLAEFYREELERCHACLQSQRDCYSPCTVVQVADALDKVMCQLESLCREGTADRVVSGVLHHFSLVTAPGSWTDGRFLH